MVQGSLEIEKGKNSLHFEINFVYSNTALLDSQINKFLDSNFSLRFFEIFIKATKHTSENMRNV